MYRNYLRVSIETALAVEPLVGVIPRREHALVSKQGFPVVDGQVIFAGGRYPVGLDLGHSQFIAVSRLFDAGVPEFDAEFGVVCADGAYARTILRPELARWIAADRRSAGIRVMFDAGHVHLFLRGEPAGQPVELFSPEWIFPAADYLIELLEQTPGQVERA